jgi:sugar O-acyltransferase (sialic acid O-acetyltransferase NeuD family)
MQRLIIVGAGGFGRETAWLVEEINRAAVDAGGDAAYKLLGFLDDDAKLAGSVWGDVPVLGTVDRWREYTVASFVFAIADPGIKRRLAGEMAGVAFVTLVHPRAEVAPSAVLGEGCIVQAGCVVSTNVVLGAHAGLNPQCGIGHDATVGAYSTMYWNVSLAGFVQVGSGCLLGSKTCVIQGLRLGDGVRTGAGAVVIRDLPDGCTAVGVPAVYK